MAAWEKWLDAAKTHGIAAVFAAVLLWWFMSSVSAQLNGHIAQTDKTTRILQQICVNTATLAAEPTAPCF